MRKIDKTKILSTYYRKWEENLERSNQNHGEYNSSKNPHYIDVIMNLLHVQGGLCAYTEMRLCSAELIDEKNWANGKYKDRHPEVFGQLDHFDPASKSTKAWLWDNFFFIDTDINTRVKGKLEVDEILKPDKKDYDVNLLLEYDPDNHIFIPHSNLDDTTQDRIKEMILKLGINFDPVIDSRKEYLEDKLAQKRFGLKFKINQFPTAFSMCNNA
jgi:hypothetical protein